MSFSLTTERLVLDDLTDRDLPDLRHTTLDPVVMKYVMLWVDTDEQVSEFLQHAIDESRRPERMSYMLAIRITATKEFAGITFIEIDPQLKSTAEIGYVLLPEYWQNGYASEIVRALLAFGFGTLRLHRVYGKCDDLNLPSARLMEKCGLTYEGTIREHVWLRDHWRSTRYYGMLEGEYSSRKQ